MIYFNGPAGLCIDVAGNIYVADKGNNRIRVAARLANTPSFIYGSSQIITPCPGYSSPISTPLSIAQLNTPVTETFTVLSPPTIGALAGFPATAVSGGTSGLAIPSGVTYTPGVGYTSGTDSFQVQVSDGITSTIVKIYASITPAPSPITISGPSGVCVGSVITLSATDPGIWSITNAHATLTTIGGTTPGTTASIHGTSTGTDTVRFTLSSCPVVSTNIINVNPLPATAPITGNDSVCVGTTTAMSNVITGGVWSTDYLGYASIASVSGVVTGVSNGVDDITYTVTSPLGCKASVTTNMTVVTIANAISGASSVCIGSSIPLNESISGGVWSNSNSNAVIAGSGTSISLTGVAPGIDTVMYTNTNVCGTGTVKKAITINPLVAAGTVSGPGSVCVGATIVLSSSMPGGTWTDANGDVDVYGAGHVDGDVAGIDTVFYGGACASSVVATVITVNSLSGGTIAGSNFVCLGATITLSDITPGGTWSVSNAYATVVSSGTNTALVSGVSPGTTIISYISTNVCGSHTVTKSIAVDAAVASSGTISGPATVCAGATITFTPTVPGGLWSIGNADATVGTTGVVTGVTVGIDTIVYTAACALTSATAAVIVNPLPNIGTISGNDTMCVGVTSTYTNTVAGGTWSRTGPGVATIKCNYRCCKRIVLRYQHDKVYYNQFMAYCRNNKGLNCIYA